MQIDSQRLDILIERHILETSLRHELFHLAQPKTLRRYEAEGLAMRFAGERPQAEAFSTISDERLDDILAQPTSAEMLTKAMATAYERTRVVLLNKP